VSWTQGRLDGRALGGQRGGGYLVRRYDADGRSQRMGTACAGRVAGPALVLRCVERKVPEGTWRYAVTPVLGGWTGTEGHRTAVGVEAAAAVTVTTPEDGGATRDPRPTIAGAAGGEPGVPTRVTVTLSRGRDPGAVASRLTATVDQGAWSVRPATPLRDGVYTVRAGQADPGGNTTWSTPSTFRVDTSAPSTGDDSRELGDGWHRTAQAVALSPTDPGGSGVAATHFTTDGSTPTTESRRGTRVRLDADGVHRLRIFSVDRAGNVEAVRTAGPVRIDRTAPEAVRLEPLPELVVDGQPLAASGDDALSGVAEVVYEYCPEDACHAWTPIGSSSVPADALAWHGQPADGTYRVRARMLDRAGNASASDPRTVRIDNTPPEVTEVAGGDGDGKVEAGDDLVVSFSERLGPASLPSAGRLTFSRAMEGETTVRRPGVTGGPVGTGTRAWVRRGTSLTYEGTLALEGATNGSGSRSRGARPAAARWRPEGRGRCPTSRRPPSMTWQDTPHPARDQRP
jgi:Bacterial Ig-like domain/Chitobiase/beta-hexosaminidase C-terminal domain